MAGRAGRNIGREIGRRIAEVRKEKGISASELARKVEVTPTAVWNWEKNGIMPRTVVFSSIARVLGVTEEFLRIGKTTKSGVTVAHLIDEAKSKIASAAGLPIERVKLTVEFL